MKLSPEGLKAAEKALGSQLAPNSVKAKAAVEAYLKAAGRD